MKKKRNVLLVVRWPVGGIRTFLRYVYRNFDSDGWRFTLIAPHIPEVQLLMDDLAGLDVCYVPVDRNPSPASFAFKVAGVLMWERFELVHSHGFTAGVCTALFAKLSRTVHLMTTHEVLNENQFRGARGRVKKKGMELVFGMIDTIQSVSYDAQNNLSSFFPTLMRHQGKCIVIPNGIEVQRFNEAAPRDIRNELEVGEDVFLIGFLGRFMSPKGFRYLIDATEILSHDPVLPKKPLVLTFGDGGFIREERQVIKEKELEVYFRFMPFTPNVAGTIKGLDVVAMPSLWEACGLLAMETLVCGTPLIGTDCIGLREVLHKTPASIIPKADSIALAQAIKGEMLVCRKKEFVAFTDEAARRFDVKSQSRELLTIYEMISG